MNAVVVILVRTIYCINLLVYKFIYSYPVWICLKAVYNAIALNSIRLAYFVMFIKALFDISNFFNFISTTYYGTYFR